MRSHIGCICKTIFSVSPQVSFKRAFVVTLVAFVKNFFVSPQVAFKSAFVVTLGAFVKKSFFESSSCLHKCIRSNIGCICKKTSQCQWSLASQDGFVSLVVCFDLLGPKFLMRAGRLKKGARRRPRVAAGRFLPQTNELQIGGGDQI